MTQPARIQRRRVSGWRKPDNCVIVSRPSRFGNPFTVGARYVSRTSFHDAPYPERDDRPLGTVEHPAWSPWAAWTETVAVVRDRAHAVELFRDHIAYENETWDPEVIRRELGGRDLACWCPLPEPGQPDHCHAAVLLDLANQPTA
ncbi:DUF4326 domain-containing protein [Streptomyces sp. NPDC002845]